MYKRQLSAWVQHSVFHPFRHWSYIFVTDHLLSAIGLLDSSNDDVLTQSWILYVQRLPIQLTSPMTNTLLMVCVGIAQFKYSRIGIHFTRTTNCSDEKIRFVYINKYVWLHDYRTKQSQSAEDRRVFAHSLFHKIKTASKSSLRYTVTGHVCCCDVIASLDEPLIIQFFIILPVTI